MAPDYEWLEGLERENADGLMLLFRELKAVQERAVGEGPVLISDTGPTEGGFRLDYDQEVWLREDRARWLVTLIYRGFIDTAEFVERQEGFRVEASAAVVRYALGALRGTPAQRPPARVPTHEPVRPLTEMEKGLYKRFGERAADVAWRVGPLLMRLFAEWTSHQGHP